MKIACYTDIHNQQAMLNLPTVLRSSAIKAAELTVSEWGKADIAIVGGDNVSDYPYWNRSCALPYENWCDMKDKLVSNFARVARKERVLYVNGNNDLILGDLPTPDNPPYNTCEIYHSGPMNKTLGELPEGEYYGTYAKSKGKQAGLYHLCFHYTVDGVDFFGLNIDPNTAFNTHEGAYNSKAIEWLSGKLDDIDPEGNKLIFVVGHLSATVRYYSELKETMDECRRNELYRAFSGHRNLFYLYGHIHGQGYVYKNSKDGVLTFDCNGNLLKTNSSFEEQQNQIGFHTVHMGGLRPFTTKTPFEYFEDDGLTGVIPGKSEPTFFEATGTPKLSQYLLIETSDTQITFQYRNTGSLEGYTPDDKPTPYTIKLK